MTTVIGATASTGTTQIETDVTFVVPPPKSDFELGVRQEFAQVVKAWSTVNRREFAESLGVDPLVPTEIREFLLYAGRDRKASTSDLLKALTLALVARNLPAMRRKARQDEATRAAARRELTRLETQVSTPSQQPLVGSGQVSTLESWLAAPASDVRPGDLTAAQAEELRRAFMRTVGSDGELLKQRLVGRYDWARVVFNSISNNASPQPFSNLIAAINVAANLLTLARKQASG